MDESKVKEVLGIDVLMNSLLGKLYDLLMMGGEDENKTDDNFFSWASPGIPVKAEDFEFMTQGLVGKTKPEKLKAVVAAMVEDVKKANEGITQEELAAKLSAIDSNALMRELTAQDEKDMIQQAENFFHLVDFIPDVSGTEKDGFCTYARKETEGSLAHAYEIMLRYSQVKDTPIEPDIQAVIDKYNEMLYKEAPKPVLQEEAKEEKKEEAEAGDKDELMAMFNKIISGESTEEKKSTQSTAANASTDGLPVDSDFARAYKTKSAEYQAALIEYNSKLLEGLSSQERGSALLASRNAAAYDLKLKQAMNDWITLGHKYEYERMTDFIAQVEARSIAALKRKYQENFDHSTLRGLSSNQEFHYCTLTPASFASSLGWTKMSFSHDHLVTHNDSTKKRNMTTINTNAKAFSLLKWQSKNEDLDTHYELNVNNTRNKIDIEFELCQVPIVRPWFNVTFLNSAFWRFDPGSEWSKSMLSDGNRPPEGIMPAYPTAIIFIRNLKLTFSDISDVRTKIEDYERHKDSYSGGLNLGRWFPISGGASYKSEDSTKSGSNDRDYEISGQSITIPGMQILGYKCHIMSKSPNPNPEIKNWI